MSWRRNVVPMAGWNTRVDFANPRPPAAPATLDLRLEEYYAAASIIGLLSAQLHEPDPEWVSKWALDFGEQMAAESRKRRSAKSVRVVPHRRRQKRKP